MWKLMVPALAAAALAGCSGGDPAVGCRADSLEPNDERASAARVEPGAATSLTACAGEQDWFAVKLGAGDTVKASALFEGAPESLRLTIHESKQGVPIAKGVAGGGGLEASVQPGAAGDYFVHVVAGDSDVEYKLAVEVAPSTMDCPAGQHPQNGGCVRDGCDDLGLELNDDVAKARPLLPGTYKNLSICHETDRDIYAIIAPPGGMVLNASIVLGDDAGNLDLYLTDGNKGGSGKLKTLAFSDSDGPDDHIPNWPVTEQTPVYLIVSGVKQATGSYRLDVSFDPVNPKRDCLTGCDKLLPMPGAVDPSEPEAIMDAYYVGTEADYAWARRDLAMWLQWSFAEVGKKFPGTHPLYLSDISQEDGKTPGVDVRSPRHPTTTHTSGRDADIAYYSTLEDNDYRIICGDGTDRNGNGRKGKYNDGYFCTTSKNVVDMPRQVYFLGLLTEHPLFRVVGVDQTLPMQIYTELEKQIAAGDLPARVDSRMSLGYGNAGGWAFHHHHIHLSLFDR